MADQTAINKKLFQQRFRGYYPVVIDVETGGVNPQTDALLELAIVVLDFDAKGDLVPIDSRAIHINPPENLNITKESLAITKIDLTHPFRIAMSEEEGIKTAIEFIRPFQKAVQCKRSVLVGHNAWFDLKFYQAACARQAIKKDPFHPFTCFDTATLSAVAYGHTVLSVALERAGIAYEADKSHSALYDATLTAELFCKIVNAWPR